MAVSHVDTGHIVVVEAYDGILEGLCCDIDERSAMAGLGLPLAELAERLRCRITVLGWDPWLRYERLPGSFFEWMPAPNTRLVNPPLSRPTVDFRSSSVGYREIPARDPVHNLSFAVGGLSGQSHGLLANSDPLFFLSCCLELELAALRSLDPFQAIVVPMWGGLGFVAQLARATGVPGAVDVPFAVVVTGSSKHRQLANQEGQWTRPSQTRRQGEELSLALADLVLVFDRGGAMLAEEGRLPEATPAITTPRRLPNGALDRIAESLASPETPAGDLQFFLAEPQEPASGVVAALDAVVTLERAGTPLPCSVVSVGPDTTYAPMRPRSFVDYWSSRGFARELIGNARWTWASERPSGKRLARLYPSQFEHLPEVWSELARGSLVVLSPAAAEGLAPGASLPEEVLLTEPTAECLSAVMLRLQGLPPAEAETLRKSLCETVLSSHREATRGALLTTAADAIGSLIGTPPVRQDLGRAALLLLDRRRTLRAIAAATPAPTRPPGSGTLTVVVTCFDMGRLLADTVESVWSSSRRPDELLLIDDGSSDEKTAAVIGELVQHAAKAGLPLTVIRQSNQGLAAARNAGLAQATGEFISYLDGDDLIDRSFYEIAVARLRESPTLGGVAAWALCFGDGVPDGFWNAPQPELPLLLVENTVIVPCVVRTETLRQLGGYDVRQRLNYEDWELSVRLLAGGNPIVTVPRYLQRYRVRAESLYRTMTPVQNQVMRELFFETHRETAQRFAVEVAMQLEQQVAQSRYPPHASTHLASAVRPSILSSLSGSSRKVINFALRTLRPPRDGFSGTGPSS